jgi:hypothetical protein
VSAEASLGKVDCFISYSSVDQRLAERFEQLFVEQGLSVWRDKSAGPGGLKAGDQFNAEIGFILAEARCVFVIWSKAAWESRWVQAEAIEGFKHGKLVAVRVEDIELGYPFGAVETPTLYDVRGSDQVARMRRIVQSVARLVRDGPVAIKSESFEAFSTEQLHPDVAAVVQTARQVESEARRERLEGARVAGLAREVQLNAATGRHGARVDIDAGDRSRTTRSGVSIANRELEGIGVKELYWPLSTGEVVEGNWYGKFSKDKIHGYGAINPKRLKLDGKQVRGPFVGNLDTGLGVWGLDKDTPSYLGAQEPQPCAFGRFRAADGKSSFAQFALIELVGPCVLVDESGYRYEGQHAAAGKHGLGVLWSREGKPMDVGMFDCGRLVRAILKL